MNILLLFPPNTHGKERATHLTSNVESVYPLGIGYLASILEEDEHKVTFIDCQFPYNTNEIINETIRSKSIEIVGVSSATDRKSVV